MRTQLLKSLIAVAVASTLAACANNRDRMDDTAYDTTGSSTMESGTASTAGTTLDQGVTDSTQVASTSGTTVDSAGAAQVDPTASQTGASTSGQTASSAMTTDQATVHSTQQQYPTTTSQSTASSTQQYPTSGQAAQTTAEHHQHGATASTTTTTTSTMGSQQQQQQQAGQMHRQMHSGMQASRSASEMGLTGVASKVEIVDSSQMGSSTGGATASSMDSQQMCDMYARLKSVNSTEEREAIMTQMLLNLPSPNGSSLVGVREQCAS